MAKKHQHGHSVVVGIAGIAAGIVLLAVFPKFHAVAGAIFLIVLFHLAGAALVLGSAYSILPRRIREKIEKKRGMEKGYYDFGWSWSSLNGHWLVALLLVSLSLGFQLEFAHLWPLWFMLSVAGLICFIGGIMLRTTKDLKFALLPFVDVFRSENDMVLDAGCGGGRTTLSILKVLKNGKVTAFDRFDAYYIEEGGRKQIGNNLKIAGLSDRVDIVQGDLTDIPFPDSHFDSAVSTHVLDHLKDKKRKALEEIYRTLKPGGRLLMVVWVPGWVTFSLANVFCLFLSNEKEWRKMSSETGFTLCDEGYFNGMYFAVLEKSSK